MKNTTPQFASKRNDPISIFRKTVTLILAAIYVLTIATETYAYAQPQTNTFVTKTIYQSLTEKQQQLYEIIYENVISHTETIDLRDYNFTITDLQTAYFAVDYENPDIFWTTGVFNYKYRKDSTVVSFTPVYGRTEAECNDIYCSLQSKTQSVINSVKKINSKMKRIKYIHDFLINTVTYSNTNTASERDIDGALLHGKAQCEGYSKTFAYLCQSIGINCICVYGTYKTRQHMWNMIEINNKWYHIDVTFDDLGMDIPTYDYFCISDKQIANTHTSIKLFPQPTASVNTSPYKSAGKTLYRSVDDAYAALITKIADNYAVNRNKTLIYVQPTIIRKLFSMIDTTIYASLSQYNIPKNKLNYVFKGSIFYVKFNI